MFRLGIAGVGVNRPEIAGLTQDERDLPKERTRFRVSFPLGFGPAGGQKPGPTARRRFRGGVVFFVKFGIMFAKGTGGSCRYGSIQHF